MKLKRIKYTDLGNDKKYHFILPIGSTEQHGPFAPFGTDTYITDYLVERLEKKYPELIVLPTLEYSRAQEHRDFFGTVFLSEDTFQRVLFDVCNSLHKQANIIFFTSFHANDAYIKKFIKMKQQFFHSAKIVHLEIVDHEDNASIEALLGGPIDDHAGNTEISNILAIDESLTAIPPADYQKSVVENPFETDNLKEKCSNGIADNHPQWVTDKVMGQKILDIYLSRMVKGIEGYMK
jgi:creatinine amidohydrolase/Fe(II)-dependent formamide hydrolase-like protein